ncbi:hypothetical protein B7463_g2055, partial [Scytalidium lignicola]
MAEETSSQISSGSTRVRPPLLRLDSRKLPGGFNIDDIDDLSPTKGEFHDSFEHNAEHHAENNHADSHEPLTPSPLATPSDGSLVYSYSDISAQGSDAHLDKIDEKEMRRHLSDVESSFMPTFSPIAIPDKPGADDTFLFDKGRQAEDTSQTQQEAPKTPSRKREGASTGQDSRPSSPTPPHAYKTPALSNGDLRKYERDDTLSDYAANTTLELETMSSSPAAAAAARTVSRVISMVTNTDNDGGRSESGTHTPEISENDENDESMEMTPKRAADLSESYTESLEGRSALHHQLSNRSLNNQNSDVGNTPGLALLKRRSLDKRPKFLRSRQTSQRSSISSILTNPDEVGSDVALGVDYALQSGGALPSGGFSRQTSVGLSRSISLGSMASGIEDLSADSSGRVDRSLATLTEEERNRERKPGEGDMSPPETPRANSRATLSAPTDTIIARHVRNVQVPESMVKEFRNKSGVSSPTKPGAPGVAVLGRSGKNLTLKEQSSTIERLSKENFDLKLKVMFLSDRLDKVSEEGVKEMISENVELKTGLAIMQRDNKALKRKVKDLEKELKEKEGRPDTAKSTGSNEEQNPWLDPDTAHDREEELLYLRERVEEYVTEIEKLRNESLVRENERRNLADIVRNMSEKHSQNVEVREEMDVWKDLLEQETARREQGEEENRKLREENFRLKAEAVTNGGGGVGLNTTTNIYHITKKRAGSPSRPRSVLSDNPDDRTGTFSAASTLVDELKRESEQLRHENAELRREVGAQTSMLTSRNREKERLYQEIEDLKLQRRTGGSVAGTESIFERSASRAHQRSSSRASNGTRAETVTDTEREDMENKNAELRDRINSLKIQNQDLQRELQSCMDDFEIAVKQKKEAEGLATELQEALEVAENDLLTLQAERDEALQGQEEAEIMFENLQKEAQDEIDGFADEMDQASEEIERLQNELADSQENFTALQSEMREMSESVVRLEDAHENNMKRIQELEKDLEEANKELEQLEKNLVEANGKINRLTVQQESSQGEIAFLREEQDSDKIKIGDLESANKTLEQSLQEEKERANELEQRIMSERRQRDMIATKEKEEVQQFVNELNREASNSKDEARKLRQNLTSREIEAAEWKERLMELENNLREALGDLNGTRSSFLKSIAKLQRELENTMRDLDTTKASLAEKERQIKQKDTLLESQAFETRRLTEILDKERQAHRTTKHSFETFQKTTQHQNRTLTQQEARVIELEASRQQERRKLTTLENQFRDQLTERNNLLLVLWNRLSGLCGTDWAHNNSLINGRALPSLEAVSTMLPGFSKNLLAAVKMLETTVGDFKTRVRTVERDLWKEYQTLESNLEIRSKRLDRLETMARSAIPALSGSEGEGGKHKAELNKLRDTNRKLKTELAAIRAANEVRANAFKQHEVITSPSPSIPTGPRHKSSIERTLANTLTRSSSRLSPTRPGTSASASRSASRGTTSSRSNTSSIPIPIPNPTTGGQVDDSEDYKPDMRWHIRLQELEYKLKAEREARKLDRNAAMQRLQEKERENRELVREMLVERERGRGRESRD